MKSLGIKYQLLLITLIPVLLIDSFFTYTYISNSIERENEMLRSKGDIIARQIASASEFNLYTGNLERIQTLLDQSVGTNDIVMAAVYDREGDLVAETTAASFKRSDSGEYVYFREAITSQSFETSAMFAPSVNANGQSRPLGWLNLYVSDTQLQNRVVQIVTESIVFFVAALIMAVILTFFISRRITRPIFAMVDHLRKVETGQLGKTIETTESNEIGTLQNGFNRMTESLLANQRHLNRRIQQATQQLNEAITDLETRNRELGFARDLAQDANRTKSEFLANMSHEIRTPINGIKGFISLLSQSSLDSAQQRYVDIIMKSTSDLNGIVDEILDFSKMESGKLQIVDEAFDLHEVVEQTRDLLFINVLTRGIDLNLIIFSDTPRRVVGDKLRLKQILLNLIGNAIKFTDHGRVVIRVSLEDQDDASASVLISVEDSGIGISEQDQQHLFQAFSQVESLDTRRFSGTGLGLVISQNLAGLMGGHIDMQSTPGQGSKFSLHLPFKLDDTFVAADDTNGDEGSALIFATEQENLMEVRTLLDRAGVITECELVDNEAGVEPVLQSIQRNRPYLDLLVFDLRHFDLDLDKLLRHDALRGLRVIVMHYDPGVGLAFESGHAEFVSIINTSHKIARIIKPQQAQPDGTGVSDATSDSPGKRVLLVDDNQINLKLASELIRLWGHEVCEAEHGEQAFEIFQREKFDLVILDIQMPDIDGVSLLQMMRDHAPADRTPIVALTANVLNREADRLLRLGFDYFLGKPIDEAKFRALLDGKPQRRAGVDGDDSRANEPECSFDYERSLALSAGNLSLLHQILGILQRDIPEQRQQLTDAYAERDYDRLGALAHKLQGVTCYASLPRLRRIATALQQQLDGEHAISLGRLMKQLDAELAVIAEQVAHHLQLAAEKALSAQDSSTAIATA